MTSVERTVPAVLDRIAVQLTEHDALVTPGKVQPGKGSDSSRAPQQRISFCQ